MDSQQEVPNGAADRTVHLAGLLIHKLDPQSIDCIRWGPGDREERADTGRDPSALTPTSISHISATCESCLHLQLAPMMSSCHTQVGKQEFSDYSLVLNDLSGGLLKLTFSRPFLGACVWSSDSNVGFFKAGL